VRASCRHKRLAASECWEGAVALCDLLSHRYERVTGEYSKLAAVGKRRSTLVNSIAHVERVHPAYFAVFYRGAGFPSDPRPLFVYRASVAESALTLLSSGLLPNGQARRSRGLI